MSKPPKTDVWYPFYVGDYRKDTGRLSCEQHGAYRQLIDEYWVAGPLPDDDAILARLVGLDLKVWRKHRAAVARFFTVADGEWRHGRIERELKDAGDRKAKAEARAKAAAEARWRKPDRDAPNDATSIPEALPEHVLEECPSPSPPPIGGFKDADASSVGSDEPITTAKALWSKDTDFLAAWDACTPEMRTRSSRKQAHAGWRLNKSAGPAKLAALKAYLAKDPDVQRTGGPGFHLWLRDKLEEWLCAASEVSAAASPWPGPADVRQAVERAFEDPKLAASYLASCAWREDGRSLVSANGFAVDTLRKTAGRSLSTIDVKVLLEKAR